MNDTYNTISEACEGVYKDRGSKFIAYAFPVQAEKEVKEILLRIKKEHHNARHHCFAWRIGFKNPAFRANDDGEPSSTAGKPILGQLLSYGLTNILVVVVRYFGGTLLGTTGLISAYKKATANALENAGIVTLTVDKHFAVDFDYAEMNNVMQIVKLENLNVINSRYELKCHLEFSVRESEAEKVACMFGVLPGVDIKSTDTDT